MASGLALLPLDGRGEDVRNEKGQMVLQVREEVRAYNKVGGCEEKLNRRILKARRR